MTAPVMLQRQDAHFALIVGINKYPALTTLLGPRKDAEKVRQWLLSPTGGHLPKGNIEFLEIDESSFETPESAEPTRKRINDALGRVIAGVRALLKSKPTAWANTRLYVYFSGHGIAPNAREVALLTADVQTDRLGESIWCSLYMAYLQDTELFHELVFLADCCRTAKVQAQPAGPPFNNERGRRGQVTTVLGFATGYGDLAYELTEEEEKNPDATRGFFTQALLEGLGGEAIDADMAAVNSTNLAKYVRERVLDLTATRPAPQVPILLTDAGTPVVFRPAARRPRKKVVIDFPPGLTGQAKLYDGSKLNEDGSLMEIGTYQCEAGPLELELPNGLYEVAISGELNGAPFARSETFKVLGEDKHVGIK